MSLRRELSRKARSCATRTSVSYRGFGGDVEEVQAGGICGDTDALAVRGPDGRLARRDHGSAADLQVEEDLRAELLDHLDAGLEGRPVPVRIGCDAQVLGTHAQNHFLAHVSA